jgi:YggT family protein
VRILRQLTEPLFYRVRRLMPFLYQSGLDLTPIVVILAVSFLRFVVPNLLYRLAATLAV